MKKRLLRYFIILVVVTVVYLGLSMLRTKKTLDESAPVSQSGQVISLDELMNKAIEAPLPPLVNDLPVLSAPLDLPMNVTDATITVNMTEKFSLRDEEPLAPSVPSDLTAPANEPRLLASASLESRLPYSVSGTVGIIDDGRGNKTLRFENYKGTPGPDLRIWLSQDAEGSNPLDLGFLKANEGNFNYSLPADFEVNAYQYVLVRCRAFFHTFGVGKLEK